MTAWTSNELNKTLRKPTTIWVVRVSNDLYIRSVNGRGSAWFRGVQTRHEGHFRAGGVEKAVSFVEESDSEINEQVNAAYATKYGRYAASIISHINGAQAQAATVKLVPLND